MQNEHLNRIQRDLDTMAQATGLQPTTSPAEVWLNLACIPAGLMAVAWAFLMPQAQPFWGLIPALIVSLGFPLFSRTNKSNETQLKVQHYALVAVSMVLSVLFFLWAHRQHTPLPTIISCGITAMGAMLTVAALCKPHRRYELGAGIPFTLAGIAMPFCGTPWTVPFGVAVSVAGASLAILQLRQLRSAHTVFQSSP